MKKLLSIVSILALGTSYKVESSSPVGRDSQGNIIWSGPAIGGQEAINTNRTHHGGVIHNKFKPIPELTTSIPSDIMSPSYDAGATSNPIKDVATTKPSVSKTIKEIPAFKSKELIIQDLVNTSKIIAPQMMLSFLNSEDIRSIFDNIENLNARLERIERHLNLSV